MSIVVSDLSFAYRERMVLKNICFSAKAGDLLCVLGPNGVGKSTLFKCILGLLDGYTGDIKLYDESIKKMGRKDMAKKIAYIPQSHFPTFNFTVLNTVLMGMTVHFSMSSSPGEKEEGFALETLEKLNILHLAHRGYAEISGGERQLVLIARAIVQRAKILVMDEPTANLDYGNQVRVMERIKLLAREGYTIILSTHNPEHAFLYGNKVMVILNGEIINFGLPHEELTPELLERVYGIKVNIHNILSSNREIKVCVPEIRD